jgi:hypothetical protein
MHAELRKFVFERGDTSAKSASPTRAQNCVILLLALRREIRRSIGRAHSRRMEYPYRWSSYIDRLVTSLKSWVDPEILNLGDRTQRLSLCGAATDDYRRPIISDQHAPRTPRPIMRPSCGWRPPRSTSGWPLHARYARQDRERRKTSHAALSYSCEMSLPV